MRYPLWMFLFVFVMPPFAAHALLTGKARIEPLENRVTVTRQSVPEHGRSVIILARAY